MAENFSSDENDDWETLDENGELDKQIEALEKQSIAAKKKKEKADSLQFGKVTILQNNEQRTQYTPTIKLLKRDPAEIAAQSDMGERKPSYKSLQQREAEYAEARKRILGADKAAGVMSGDELENGDVMENGSPKLATRLNLICEKPEKVVSRQPLGPELNGKGFKQRQSPSPLQGT